MSMKIEKDADFFMEFASFFYKDTLNKLGYKAKIKTHTTSYIN